MYDRGRWRERRSARGFPYWVWERSMPRLPSWLPKAVVYLYPTEDHARQGARSGGTGFLIGIGSDLTDKGQDDGPTSLYAVTNSHVIREADSPVIRINTLDGVLDVLPLTGDDWYHH